MSYIYAMSDIHGCLAEFLEALELVDLSGDNKLILLGDYIHGGPDPFGVLDKVMELERQYGPDKVIALVGNHEDMAMDGRWPIAQDAGEDVDEDAEDEKYLRWMQKLRRYYATRHQIFCHAGVEEEAEDMWEWGTNDYTFTEKYPPETGTFCMDIIAGHVGTAEISGDPGFHDIYWDGKSHYFIDGTVLKSGVIPVLKHDTAKERYFQVTAFGDQLIEPYDFWD